MSVYRRIDNVNDIRTVAIISLEKRSDSVRNYVSKSLGLPLSCIPRNDDMVERVVELSPDLLFIDSAETEQHGEMFNACRQIRESGYEGIVMLVADDISGLGESAFITSWGFDNYLLDSDCRDRMEDCIKWAILNRRRRNKSAIQFDDSADMLFTVDRKGRIYDLNEGATEGSRYTPKEVVNRGVKIWGLGTLECFSTLIKPLIEADNIERVFRQSVEEGERIFQIRTKIHNVATIGLTATIAKTDITEAIYSHTLDILINSVSLLSQRDNYTASHSSRVFYYCKHIAGKLGLTKNRKSLRDLYFAALLHDVGKIGVRDDVLLKRDSLTREEFGDISTHPVKAYRLLQPHSFLRGASELVRFHHERVDGRGYPDKLKGNRIPLGSSIIAVADGFDAMTTTRPYRKELAFDKALSEIRANMGTQYNIDAGEAFLSVISPSLMDEVRQASRKPLGSLSRELISNILM